MVVLLGLVAAAALPRFFTPSQAAKRNACYVNKGEIEVQAHLWLRNKGAWPQADLDDIGSDPAYFPLGLPTCPVDGAGYTFDHETQRVIGHNH